MICPFRTYRTLPPFRRPALLLVECTAQKKADAAEHANVFNDVGLLVNGLPDNAGLPFI
jgi:hypothetical protein